MSPKRLRPTIGLKELWRRVYRRMAAVREKVYRRAAGLVLSQNVHVAAAQRRTLEALADGKATSDSVVQDTALHSIVRPFLKEAEAPVYAEEAHRLGYPLYKKTAWQAVGERFFEAAEQCVPGFCVNSLGRGYVAEEYGRRVETGDIDPNDQMERAVAILDKMGFAAELLGALWAQCPEECRAMKLPERLRGPTPTGGDTNSLEGYASADTIEHNHGIVPARLSEAKTAGNVRSKPAPAKMIDSQGKPVHLLYHVEDAKRHCAPKHVKKKTLHGLERKS